MSLRRFPYTASHPDLHREWDIWMDFKNVPPYKSIRIPAAELPFSAAKQRQILKELDVENSPRYKPGAGKTYCNIFVSDFLDALGLPPTHTEGGVELSANAMIEWLASPKGAGTGWVQADRQTALDAAARGHVVLVSYFQTAKGRSGHIAVVLPEGTIAQAGKSNFMGGTIRSGFGDLPLIFFVQSRGPHAVQP